MECLLRDILPRAPITETAFAFNDKPALRCSACGHRRALDVELHNHLQVTLLVAGRVVADVQAAIQRIEMPTETPPDYRWLCENCGSTETPTLCHTFTAPQVLCVQLKRWGDIEHPGPIFDRVIPNDVIRFGDYAYELRGSILHSGPTPNAGHYVSCVRHDIPAPLWWFYNDTLRREASEDERTSSLEFKSYVLVL